MNKIKYKLNVGKIAVIHCIEHHNRKVELEKMFKSLNITNDVEISECSTFPLVMVQDENLRNVLSKYFDRLDKSHDHIIRSFNALLNTYQLINKYYNQGYETLLLCEDGLYITDINKLNEYINNAPKDYDAIIFNCVDYKNINNEFTRLENCWCGGAYCVLYNRSGMKAYLDKAQTYFTYCDTILWSLTTDPSLHIYCPTSRVVDLNVNTPSEIDD